MGARTPIEWTRDQITGTEGATWNPLAAFRTDVEPERRGHFCIKAGDDCLRCYAEGMNLWVGNGLAYIAANLEHIRFELVNLDLPRRWRGHPRNIFVESMSDLMLPIKRAGIPLITYEMRSRVFDEMLAQNMHIYQFLTKHADELARFVKLYRNERGWSSKVFAEKFRHVHVAVSAGNQKYLEKRAPHLLDCPFEVRLLSLEPLIAPVELSVIRNWPYTIGPTAHWDTPHARRIQGVLLGGESYFRSPRRARAMSPQWARGVRDFCALFGMEFFDKQWGEWKPLDGSADPPEGDDGPACVACGCTENNPCEGGCNWIEREGLMQDFCSSCRNVPVETFHGIEYVLAGKKKAGRWLDGVEHSGYPRLKEFCQ
jgi:protein gp37